MNGYFRTIAGGLIAVSIPLTATGAKAAASPMFPAPDQHRSISPFLPQEEIASPEPEWPPSLPAAKAADVCESVDVASLEGDELIDYLRATSLSCLERTLYSFNNPAIRKDLPTVFSDRNMQTVFAEIERSSPTYDGTESAGMVQLWFFAEVGYTDARFFHEQTGVGPFNQATHDAYIAASDAFAASDHFFDHNDEAARILFSYFEVAYAAGMRRNHLGPIKRVLSGFTPERAANETQAYYYLSNVVNRVYWTFSDHDRGLVRNPEFIDAVSKDPEFVEAILQVTRYDFFFLVEDDHPAKPRKVPLERALYLLVRLTRMESLKEAAVAALTSVLSWHERLSGPFLMAARGLENQVDCAGLNICRDVLESEIYARALPNKYSLDGGALVFDTSLPLEEVLPMSQGAKEIKARFHRVVETDEPVVDGLEVFTTRMYATRYDYGVFEAYLDGLDTRFFPAGYYSNGTMATHVTPLNQRMGGFNRDHVDVFRHEYGHYLADRFGLLRFGDLWFDEGLAEFLDSRHRSAVRYVSGRETRPHPAKIFRFAYTSTFADNYSYNFSHLFFRFMHQQRRTELLELLDLVRSGNHSDYKRLIETWGEDAQLAADYDSFLDEQVANVEYLPDPSSTYILPLALTSDSAPEIEGLMQQVDGGLGMNCQSTDTGSEHGFVCTGSLPAESGFSGDRGDLNQHLNTRLDDFIAGARDQGEINNFKVMTCYFSNVSGSPPVADLRCEGPLRPLGIAQAQVDLMVRLVSGRGDFDIHVGERHLMAAYLEFSAESASNVTMTWSSSLPIAKVNLLSWVPCEVVEETRRRGKLTCGQVHKRAGETPLGVEIYFNPRRPETSRFPSSSPRKSPRSSPRTTWHHCNLRSPKVLDLSLPFPTIRALYTLLHFRPTARPLLRGQWMAQSGCGTWRRYPIPLP